MRMNSLKSTMEQVPVSYPIRVEMAGFTSDTLKLQRAGWQLSMETFSLYDRASTQVRMAMKHDGLRQYAIADTLLDDQFLHSILGGSEQGLLEYFKQMGFHIRYLAPNITMQIIPSMGIPKFQPIDATPQWVDRQEINLEQMCLFRPLNPESEILVHPDSVNELMEIILKKQEPKQREIIEKKRRERMREDVRAQMNPEMMESRDRRDIKAQLVVCA